ncbi:MULTISPECIES: AAA family ATPase [Bartonella]|uniref:AAA family ATPase n=1 Tax=Bartonella TaxID=773 RepID=UPI001ABBD05E|nr:AAA family ATPase [Bartonella grahamii]
MYLQNEEALLLARDMRESRVNLNVLGLGKRSPYIGREEMIRTAMVSLFCAYKKSIVISGPAGCGKTSFVRELAFRLNQFKPMLNGYVILEVNLGSVISDTGLRGEFERKIGTLIETVSPYENVALFIDEGHSIANTRSDGGIGAMDLFKPFMLEQNLKLIIATTSAELAHIQGDAAFFRRFHHVRLGELSIDEKMNAIRLHIKYLEEYHGRKFCFDNFNFDNTSDLHDLLSHVDLQLARGRFENEFAI